MRRASADPPPRTTRTTRTEPQYSQQRPPPPYPACPDFFSTTVTPPPAAPTFGPMTNSIHYVLTAQRVNYGRNTWIRKSHPSYIYNASVVTNRNQSRPGRTTPTTVRPHPFIPSLPPTQQNQIPTEHRLVSNLQDTPIRNVEYCQVMLAAYDSPAKLEATTGGDGEAPVFKNRVKYGPRIKGTQPAITTKTLTGTDGYWDVAKYGDGTKTAYCVTVPYMKPKGRQKVNLLWYTEPCLYNVVFAGWVEYQNPYNAAETCGAAFSPNSTTFSTKKNSVRTLDVSAVMALPGPALPGPACLLASPLRISVAGHFFCCC